MLLWLKENIGTIVVALVLLIIVTAVIGKMIRDKRRGKSTCGCGCEQCAMHGKCHTADRR